jgi:hypothetical protein
LYGHTPFAFDGDAFDQHIIFPGHLIEPAYRRNDVAETGFNSKSIQWRPFSSFQMFSEKDSDPEMLNGATLMKML